MSETELFIVVDDPEDQYYEGSLVDPLTAQQLGQRGVVLLPVDPALFSKSGAGGYFKRAWGSGWPLDSLFPKINAPLVLYCDPQHKCLSWAARLAATGEFLALDPAGRAGQLQVAVDTGQRSPFNASLTEAGKPVVVRELGAPDADGGWTVQGTGTVACQTEGHYGFGLYGYAPGLRVLWAALTVTKERSRR